MTGHDTILCNRLGWLLPVAPAGNGMVKAAVVADLDSTWPAKGMGASYRMCGLLAF